VIANKAIPSFLRYIQIFVNWIILYQWS